MSFPNLEVLDLSSNYIGQIEGMENMPQLQEINLERNIIDQLEGFQMNNCLQLITLSNQSLPRWRYFEISPQCAKYQENIVVSFMDPVNLGQFPYLKKLILKDNVIEDMMSFLSVLKACIGIEEVDVRVNPFTIANKIIHKNFIVLFLKNIVELEGKTVKDNEKAYVNNLFLCKFGKSKPVANVKPNQANLELSIKLVHNPSKKLSGNPYKK